MTKDAWRIAAKNIWEAAFANDPIHTEEVTYAVLGRAVFAWDLISTQEIRQLHGRLFATARLS